jgi:micrococcal nuclease
MLGFHRRSPAPAFVLLAVALAGCGSARAAHQGPPDGVRPIRAHAARGGFPGPAHAHRAVVTHVTDGDTVTLSAIGKTRLIGIDTPEVYGHTECFGRAASAFTKRVLAIGTRVEYRLGLETHDVYGRSLAYVWLPDGRMFNGVLAEKGYATPLTIPPNDEYALLFVAAARRAREHDRGLWSPDTCNGVNPPNANTKSDKDCSDFTTHAEAQAYFDSHGGSATNNFDNLDGSDHDGRVCESLP